MTRARTLVVACALALAPGLAGCLQIERVTLDIDLVHRTATLRFFNIGGTTPDADATALDAALVPDERTSLASELAAFGLRWVELRGNPRVVERTTNGKTTIYGDVTVGWSHPYEVGLSSVDADHPYRFCLASTALAIAATDAVARDGHGCAIWDARATTLHVELAQTSRRVGPQPFVRAWRAMHR